ncbi:MAG: hypothetical protein C5B44_05275 [Acidobacteria bacterium]|nr:MAG: hypothetical protein C5B44_05275 [Acidobacteriota bacterium]
MNPDQWQQLQKLFYSALEREPADRLPFLENACGGDKALRNQIEALLAAHDRAGSFIESPGLEVEARLLANDHVELATGATIAHYTIISSLGVGGMGEVYLAHDSQLGRKVALKLLPPGFTMDADRVRRLQQEARVASGLNHPNIITIYEIGRVDGRHFIAMEFVDGKTLRQLIETRSHGTRDADLTGAGLKLREVLNIAIQVADALDAAHEVGIVHRDIKPENIMVRQRDGYAKVLDFGLATLTKSAANEVNHEAPTLAQIQTSVGSVMGTASYMSPEQARGERVDARTDLWSLGVVVYEMVAGKPPFAGSTSQDVMAAILRDEPKSMWVDVPDRLRWIVEKALRKERNERYQTAREMVSDLRDLKKHEDDIRQRIERPASSNLKSGVRTRESTTEEQADVTGDVAAGPTSSESSVFSRVKRRSRAIIGLTAIVSVLAAIAFGWYRFIGQKNQIAQNPTRPVVPFQTMKIARLTSTGKVTDAAISPDGKYVVQVVDEGGQESLWMKHVATSSNVQINPPADVKYLGLTFSPGGDYLYYNAWDKKSPFSLYQMPVLGGASRKLVVDIDSVVTFSPDGKQFAYVRGLPTQSLVSLFVSNVDGTGERKVATRGIPTGPSMGEPAWSPDGKVIVWPAPRSDSNGTFTTLVEVRLADGFENPISSQHWAWVGHLSWLPDGSGLVFNARERVASPSQIWHVSYPDGEVHRVTNDLNDYLGVSLTSNSSALVTVESEQVSNIWIAPNDDAKRAIQITNTKFDGVEGLSWTHDGKIVYTTRAGGNQDLWMVNADGSGQKQLTADAGNNGRPSVSYDGRYIVFVSDRTGTNHIWRSEIDGSNPVQLTNGNGEISPLCSPTSPWVAYELWSRKPGLWKVPIDGGDSVQIIDKPSGGVAISPDSKWIASADFEPRAIKTAIYPVEGGEPQKILDIFEFYVRWTPDGRALAYVDRNHPSNVSSQTVDTGAKRQLTDFNGDLIFRFDWSRDGKQLALARGSLTHDVVLINNFIAGN